MAIRNKDIYIASGKNGPAKGKITVEK